VLPPAPLALVDVFPISLVRSSTELEGSSVEVEGREIVGVSMAVGVAIGEGAAVEREEGDGEEGGVGRALRREAISIGRLEGGRLIRWSG
jgi:hypothetical protein